MPRRYRQHDESQVEAKTEQPAGPKPCDKDEAINIAKQLRADQGRDRLIEFLRAL